MSVANRPTLHPNSQKYREQTIPHATGRSGSASLTLRALLNASGATRVEATTGMFGETPPGEIVQIQLKALNEKGKLGVSNLRGNGTGYWSRDLVGTLAHAAPVQVQALIRGIDKTRTDVITLTEPVRRLPDLSVTAAFPASPPLNTPVPLLALVRELNGEVGARFNCTLSIDGVVVDQISNAWVANGDVVQCAFTHVFTQSGWYLLTIAAHPVDPAEDWNVYDNAVSGTVVFQAPITGSLSVHEQKFYTWARDSHDFSDPSGFDHYHYDYENSYHDQSLNFHAQGPAIWSGRRTLKIRLSSDVGARDSIFGDITWGSLYDYGWSVYIEYEGNASYIWGYHSSYAVSYISRYHWKYWWDNGDFIDSYEEGSDQWMIGSYGTGTVIDFGSALTVDIELRTSTGQVLTVSPVLHLPDWTPTEDVNEPYNCYTDPFEYCHGYIHTARVRSKAMTF